MENASRALLIAGGVLVAIIILSMGVYLYVLFSGQAKTYKETISTTELQKFNSNFEIYIGRNDLTPFEVITAKNIAQEYENTSWEIDITVNSLPIYGKDEDFLRMNIDTKFSCSYSDANYENGRITSLNFNV